jgi:hypothetical protein
VYEQHFLRAILEPATEFQQLLAARMRAKRVHHFDMRVQRIHTAENPNLRLPFDDSTAQRMFRLKSDD